MSAAEVPGAGAAPDDVVLTLDDVSKAYGAALAVKRATFHVRRGAVNVLVGENGAGKSTLMKIIAGVERPTLGRILLEGVPVHFPDTAAAVAHGIGMVFQELNLFGNLSVAENVFAAREVTRGLRGIDHREQERRAGELMARLQTGIDPRTPVEDLRIGQQQLVEIAKAVAQDARILIMDEPTSALSATGGGDPVPRHRRPQAPKGVGIVYISAPARRTAAHRRLHHGAARWPRHRLAARMQGRRRRLDRAPDDRLATPRISPPPVEPRVRRRDVLERRGRSALPRSTGGLAVDHVSASDVRAGEILGVYGLMGAGRSELLECVMGRHRARHRPPLYRGQARSGSATSPGRIAARPRADPRGSPARRPRRRSSRSPRI